MACKRRNIDELEHLGGPEFLLVGREFPGVQTQRRDGPATRADLLVECLTPLLPQRPDSLLGLLRLL